MGLFEKERQIQSKDQKTLHLFSLFSHT